MILQVLRATYQSRWVARIACLTVLAGLTMTGCRARDAASAESGDEEAATVAVRTEPAQQRTITQTPRPWAPARLRRTRWRSGRGGRGTRW